MLFVVINICENLHHLHHVLKVNDERGRKIHGLDTQVTALKVTLTILSNYFTEGQVEKSSSLLLGS